MNHKNNSSKISFIRKKVINDRGGLQIITDKAIKRVLSFLGSENNLPILVEKVNRELVIPIKPSQAESIIQANKDFHKCIVDKVVFRA